jgi:hypothetical protein
MRRLARMAGLVTVAILASAMVVPLSLPELVAQSDVIVHGQVARLESSRTAVGSSIHTDVTLRVIDVVLSDKNTVARDELTFRVEGGIVEGQEIRTSIDPTFTEGDEGIFFLSSDTGREHLSLVGGAQGYIRTEDGMVGVSGDVKPVDALISELRGYGRR